MPSCRSAFVCLAWLAFGVLAAAQSVEKMAGLGRNATPLEVAAWDIDVRPDFKGLPAGSGSVAQGQAIWEDKCASCHGFFGESGEKFSPVIGGIQAQDLSTGHVANLTTPDFPWRTTFMKVATISTVWDFINRAMPWTAPKTLQTNEVYAVLAFMLSLDRIVPDDFTLDEKTIREVQARMPNRNGMTTDHALWPGQEFGGAKKPDTHNVACMKNCASEPRLSSVFTDFAHNAHGNLAEQNRLVGPAYPEDANKHADQADSLAARIKSGGAGIWGQNPRPAHALSVAESSPLADGRAAGAGK